MAGVSRRRKGGFKAHEYTRDARRREKEGNLLPRALIAFLRALIRLFRSKAEH